MKVQHSTLMHQDIRGTYTTGIVKSRVFISAILFACTAVNSPLHASELENAEDSSGGETIEKIVVSARKKAGTESIQEVPMAITAVSGDVIDKRFFADLTDVANIAPNVNLSPAGTTPGTANFFIRGMGVFGSIPSDETSVGVIQDGLYLGVNSGALTTLFDIESVEVLRGPQGTLFGRNVTGGAVVVNSRRPTEDTRAKVRARVGNYGQKSVDVAVGGALSADDNWLGRLVVGTQSNDDYFDNVNPNVPDRGEAETHFVRPSLTYVANEDLSITLIGEYNKFKGDGVISKNVSLLDTLKDHEVDSDIDNKAEYTVKHLITDVDWTVGEGNIRVIAGWETLIDMVRTDSFCLTKETACSIQKVIGQGEALEPGQFRTAQVGIAGTEYAPPQANKLDEIFARVIKEILELQDIREQAYRLHLDFARNQFFWDGNKRTGLLMLNGHLMSNGYSPLSIPAKRLTEYNAGMIDFYDSGDSTQMLAFLKECHKAMYRRFE